MSSPDDFITRLYSLEINIYSVIVHLKWQTDCRLMLNLFSDLG
jgi:hypothetical protein